MNYNFLIRMLIDDWLGYQHSFGVPHRNRRWSPRFWHEDIFANATWVCTLANTNYLLFVCMRVQDDIIKRQGYSHASFLNRGKDSCKITKMISVIHVFPLMWEFWERPQEDLHPAIFQVIEYAHHNGHGLLGRQSSELLEAYLILVWN